jgi:hypothetical protein
MLCFRLFSESNPAVPLADAVSQLREGQAPKDLYAVEPASFQQIPNAPFAYWVSERIRRLFIELPAFDGDGRTVCVGLQTSDDFRFVRVDWETPTVMNMGNPVQWFTFAKGGGYAPFYGDIALKINYAANGSELLHFGPSVIRNAEFYHKSGLTWSYRPSKLGSFRVLPRGVVFSVNGPSAFISTPALIMEAIGLTNSKPFNYLVRLLFSRGGEGSGQTLTYEVGYVGSTPVPFSSKGRTGLFIEHVSIAWSTKRRTDTATLSSHAFLAPALAPCRKLQPTR